MIVVLVKATDAFRINNQHADLFSALSVSRYRSSPYPKSFGARVDTWPNAESFSILHINQTPIEQEALASAVNPSDRENTNGPFDLADNFLGFLADLKDVFLLVPTDQWNSLLLELNHLLQRWTNWLLLFTLSWGLFWRLRNPWWLLDHVVFFVLHVGGRSHLGIVQIIS